ncbi:hypothetical protein HDU85_007591 [Gaertneriomyces sp. JEL0708]|nr:hypothetical protein HDU85_007591 [Gaertneriomyces sp. JEL0708]
MTPPSQSIDPTATESGRNNTETAQSTNLTNDDYERIAAENAQLEKEVREQQAAAKREAEFAAMLARNAELKAQKAQLAVATPVQRQSAAPIDDRSTSSPSPPVERALKFTPVTDGRLDFYAHTMNSSNPANSVSAPVPVQATASTRHFAVKIPAPEPFDGLSKPGESAEARLEVFIPAIEKHIHHQSLIQGVTPSAAEFCANACFYLTGAAASIVNRLELRVNQSHRATGVPVNITWPEVRDALRSELGKPLAGHMLINKMMKVAQKSGESVDALTDRFELMLLELTRQNLDSRDLVVALYLNALSPPIRERLEETVNSKQDYFAQASITSNESRAALSHLRTLAKAREAFLSSQKANNNQTHNSQQRNPPSQPNSQSTKTNTQSRGFERVPEALFYERMNNGQCGKCGTAGHGPKSCPNKRVLTAVPASSASTSRTNHRFNMMNAEAEAESRQEQHESPQPQPTATQPVGPKNQ